MKILQVSFSNDSGGGVGRYVSTLSERLEACGHRIDHLRLMDDACGDIGPAHSAYRLPPSYGLVHGRLLRGKMRETLSRIQPDLIHVHECFTTLSSVLLSELRQHAPVVGTLHDVRPFCYLMTRRFSRTGVICTRQCGASCFSSGCIRPQGVIDTVRLMRRWMVDRLSLEQWRQLDRVMVPSRYMLELGLQHGLSSSRLRLVPHGTEVPPNPAPAEQRNEPALIVYLGSLLDYKGPALLLEALSLIREQPWHAVFAGDGPLRASLEKAVRLRQLSDKVDFRGHISDDGEIRRLLGSARLLALPSLIPESFSLAGIEALAVGTPVVSFATGGIAEWFHDGDNGLRAQDGDPADLALQMSRLIADPAMAIRLGRNGHQLVASEFSAQKTLGCVQAVYGELVGMTT